MLCGKSSGTDGTEQLANDSAKLSDALARASPSRPHGHPTLCTNKAVLTCAPTLNSDDLSLKVPHHSDHETVRISNQNIRNAHAYLYYHTKKTARTYCQNLVFSVARGNQRQPAMKPFVSKLKRSCFEACFEMWDMQRQVPQFDAGAGQLVE